MLSGNRFCRKTLECPEQDIARAGQLVNRLANRDECVLRRSEQRRGDRFDDRFLVSGVHAGQATDPGTPYRVGRSEHAAEQALLRCGELACGHGVQGQLAPRVGEVGPQVHIR